MGAVQELIDKETEKEKRKKLENRRGLWDIYLVEEK